MRRRDFLFSTSAVATTSFLPSPVSAEAPNRHVGSGERTPLPQPPFDREVEAQLVNHLIRGGEAVRNRIFSYLQPRHFYCADLKDKFSACLVSVRPNLPETSSHARPLGSYRDTSASDIDRLISRAINLATRRRLHSVGLKLVEQAGGADSVVDLAEQTEQKLYDAWVENICPERSSVIEIPPTELLKKRTSDAVRSLESDSANYRGQTLSQTSMLRTIAGIGRDWNRETLIIQDNRKGSLDWLRFPFAPVLVVGSRAFSQSLAQALKDNCHYASPEVLASTFIVLPGTRPTISFVKHVARSNHRHHNLSLIVVDGNDRLNKWDNKGKLVAAGDDLIDHLARLSNDLAVPIAVFN